MPASQDGRHLVPQHVAIIMDGNGRWAKQRGLPRLEGHRQGAERAREVVQWAVDAGIKQLSLYAFSTENWERPKAEVRGLMALLSTLLPSQLPRMQQQGVRLLVLGDVELLPARARKAVQKSVDATCNNSTIDLVLCLNYGGQQEIVAAAKSFCRKVLASENPMPLIENLDVQGFRHEMWRDHLLPVDLLIRTGGEKRISNFHLWDAAYAELYFSDTFWPDYSQDDFNVAIADFVGRERRFGLTSEQLTNE